MTTFTPQDLTEGCLVSGTKDGLFTFTDVPVNHGRHWSIGAPRWVIAEGDASDWFGSITVTDIKPAPKPPPLWMDPAIPDDALFDMAAEESDRPFIHTAHYLRSAWPNRVPDNFTNPHRVWLLNDTEVAVKKTDLAGFSESSDCGLTDWEERRHGARAFFEKYDGGAR